MVEAPVYQSNDLVKPTAKETQEFTLREIAFFRDLETKRGKEEIELLREAFRTAVIEEQERLLSEVDPAVIEKDIITGDRPFKTSYDRLKGKDVLISPSLAAEALLSRFYNLWILNHPTRIDSLKSFIESGYHPSEVKKHIPVIENAIATNTALDFDDLGMMYPEPDPDTDVDDSARKLLAHGPFTWVAENLAAIPYVLSSMPDISNSMSIATHVLSGGLAFVPFDSKWSKYDIQLQVVKRAWEIIEDDMVIQNHPDKEFLLSHYRRLIAPTLKVNAGSIDEMVNYLKQGITTFRFYDARARSKKMADLSLKIRERLEKPEFDQIRDKITIFWGQMRGEKTSKKIKSNLRGIVGLGRIVGLMGGGICSTAKESNQHVQNVNDGYKMLQADPTFPTLFDGGVGSGLPVVLSMGGVGALKSQALVGGCLEQPPFLWYQRVNKETLAKNFSGEAAPRTKNGGGKTDFLGRPLFVEGADTAVQLNPDALTMTDNTYSLLQSLATAMIFGQVKEIDGFWRMEESSIGTATELSKKRASVHQHGGDVRRSINDVFPNIPLTIEEEPVMVS